MHQGTECACGRVRQSALGEHGRVRDRGQGHDGGVSGWNEGKNLKKDLGEIV